MSEVVLWLGRVLAVLPELIGLWKATEAKDGRAQLEAQLALVRKMEDEQAKAEIGHA